MNQNPSSQNPTAPSFNENPNPADRPALKLEIEQLEDRIAPTTLSSSLASKDVQPKEYYSLTLESVFVSSYQ